MGMDRGAQRRQHVSAAVGGAEVSGGLMQESRQQTPKFGIPRGLAQPPGLQYLSLHCLKVPDLSWILLCGVQGPADRGHYLGRVWAPGT
jgi:hypothetical protein